VVRLLFFEKASPSCFLQVLEWASSIATRQDEAEASKKMRCVTLLVWLSKSLAQRNHPSTTDLVHLLFDYFGDSDVGEVAASGIGIILWESDEVHNCCSGRTCWTLVLYSVGVILK